MVDTAVDIVTDSIIGRCCAPITYFPNDEYKHLIARNPMKIENKVLMNCCEKLLALYNQRVDSTASEICLIARDVSFTMFGMVNILYDEIQMMRDEGVYGCNLYKLPSFRRYLYLIKWAYFPSSLDRLKFKKIP